MARCSRLFSIPFHGPNGEDRWACHCTATGWSAWVLCDGASESYDGAGWAQALAKSLAENLAECLLRGNKNSHEAVPRAATTLARRRYQRWQSHSGTSGNSGQKWPTRGMGYADTQDTAYSSQNWATDWLHRASLKRGSWSTALGLRCSPHGTYIEAWALGDTELFVLDGWEERHRLPLLVAEDFSATPLLVASSIGTGSVTGGSGGDPETRPRWLYRKINLKNLKVPRLVMVSDALAAFIISEKAGKRSHLWRTLLSCPLEYLEQWLHDQEASGRLSRDDHTLIEVRP